MRLLIFIVHSVSIITITTHVVQGISLSKPGCPEKCGNVTIPYPFGVGSKCSANSWFTITCRNATSNRPPKPFLSLFKSLEVVEISLDENTVQVMKAVSLLNCSSTPRSMQLGEPFLDSPFTFSIIYNRLVVLGCKNVVWLFNSGNSPSYGGCSPVCGYTTFGCNGINCCKTTIPPQLQELLLSYINFEQGYDISSHVCGYAFLVDHRWLASEYRNYRSFQNSSEPLDLSLEYVPVILDWKFDISEKETTLQGIACVNRSDYSSPSFDDNHDIDSVNTTRCYCETGFQGNPYLPGRGCQDIDECSNTTLSNNCIAGTCTNTIGSFTCHQYPGDTNRYQRSIIICISSGIGALLLVFGGWISTKVIRERIKANRRNKFFKRNGGLLLQKHELSSNDGGIEKTILFSSKELSQATDHYNENRILGRGGQGTVYKGMLKDGRIVAIKKSKRVDKADIEVFINEVVILSQINHRNVVKLLGCCLETEVPILVYEFIPNGTLFHHIHDQNDIDEFPLSWKMRVRIATEVAGALSYLHSAASAPIYHRDIKSTNILLDDKYRAKVSDFGTSRSIAIDQTHLTTRVMGTFGYFDPEYFQSSQFTEKSDVYSFGVVMVELLTGEKAISTVRDEAGKSLATHFLHSMEENNLFDILDPEVLKEGRKEEIMAIAKLARRCLSLNGKRRPTMKEVAMELEGIFQSNHENTEFHSIELFEVTDFTSISDSTSSDVTTVESSESPLASASS